MPATIRKREFMSGVAFAALVFLAEASVRVGRIDRERVASAVGVALLHALLGLLLLRGLGFVPVVPETAELKTFDVAPEPPPPPPPEPLKVEAPKQKARAPEPEGAAAPPNLRDTPTPIVALPPVVKLVVPSPIVAAPIAGEGNRDSAGAAEVPGPGTGSGGTGTGTGSGDSGNGTGGGGGGGMSRPVRWVSGYIGNRDYPRAAIEARAQGTLLLTFIAQADGRVGGCRITRSSGNRALDETTCRLITRRFRYRPALDGDGNPVPTRIDGEHEWTLAPEREPIDVEPTIEDE